MGTCGIPTPDHTSGWRKRCKDCGEELVWVGPGTEHWRQFPTDWAHASDMETET